MNNNNLKTQICDSLAAWIRQRPGLETGNYFSPYDRGEQLARGISAYRGDARSIARDKRDAETLLVAVRHNDSITAEMLLDAAKHSYSGRLELQVDVPHQIRRKTANGGTVISEEKRVHIEYTTGQYWCTEFRKAAAAVLAGALWSAARDTMDIETGADTLRKHFRKEFGSNMQRRWFD